MRTETYYYAAYDLKRGGKLIGIAHQTIGKRGGKRKARWLEPVHRRVTKDELDRYKFHSFRFSIPAINWTKDNTLREQGIHIES